jgi:hypothetical protein
MEVIIPVRILDAPIPFREHHLLFGGVSGPLTNIPHNDNNILCGVLYFSSSIHLKVSKRMGNIQ